jgi:putative ABC transport system permease protein
VIATANVAGLLLARGVTRTNEVAVRRALGAAGTRVTRQLLTETVLLSVAAGTVGLVVAWNLLAIFQATTPSAFALTVPLDWRVLMFAAAVCIGTGVLVGLAPALQAGRVNVLAALGATGAGTGRSRGLSRYWIVIPQIALSVILLVVAGVHVRALRHLELADRGYATEGGIVIRPRLWNELPPWQVMELPDDVRRQFQDRMSARARVFSQAVLDRIGALTGPDRVALVDRLPYLAYTSSPDHVVGLGSEAKVDASYVRVSGGYFAAMDIRLESGRTFDSRDSAAGRTVAIVSRSLERRLWPIGRAVGKTIAFEPQWASSKNLEWLEIIGTVEDVMPILGTVGDQPLVYRPAIETGESIPMFYLGRPGTLVVRPQGDRGALISRIKAVILGTDAFSEVSSIQTTEQLVGEILYPRRVGAGILVAAGCVGLTLAALGLYALMSYSVAQRRREIGIRTSLGASPRDLTGLVLRDAARVIAIGGGLGVLGAAVAVRLTAGLVPGLPFVDMFALISVPLVLAAVILVASYLPARRAARVDPIEALRAN